VVSRAGQHRERRVAEDPRDLLVLRLRAVIGDVPRHQQRVDVPRQLPEAVAHPLRALRGPFAAVQMQITDVREYEHGRTPPESLLMV
jgi:hypothetical protein